MTDFVDSLIAGAWAAEEVIKELNSKSPEKVWKFDYETQPVNVEEGSDCKVHLAKNAEKDFPEIRIYMRQAPTDKNWFPLTAVVSSLDAQNHTELKGFLFEYSALDGKFLGLVPFNPISGPLAPEKFCFEASFVCPKHSTCCR